MKTLTHEEFINRINEYNGVTFLTCSIETDPRLKKGGRAGVPQNPFIGTVKQTTLNGAVGFDYEHSVNLQRDRENVEEEFEAKPRAWGILMEGRKFVEHKGNYYLQLKVENSTQPKYVFNGEEIEKEKLEPWLPKRKPSSTQGVEKEVIIRDVKLNNIKKVTFGGNTYLLVENNNG